MPHNAFIIRCAPSKISRIDFVLQENQIVIGWSDTKELLLNETISRDDFKKILIQKYIGYNENPYSLGQAVGYLWRFNREMQIGDYVLVPIARAFYLGIIESKATYYPEGVSSDIAIRRNVKWLNNKNPIPRNLCDAGLTSRLKYQGTCVGAGDLIESIEKALNAVKNFKEVSFKEQAKEKLKEDLINIFSSTATNLSPSKFEELVRQLLQALGASASEKPSNRKYKNSIADVDVIADFEHLAIRIYVQVKYHNYQTDMHAVKQVIEAIKKDNPDNLQPIIGWVVSSAKFTNEATNLANDNGIRCIDVEELTEMILSVGLNRFKI